MQTINIETADWRRHRAALCAIREEVFIDEQQVPRDIELDGADETATHFLVTEGGAPIACGRLLPDGKVGRMAVLKAHRNRGLGTRLLRYIIDHARRHALPRLYLHAQQTAVNFYRTAGFQIYGEPFEEAGIPHRAMELVVQCPP